MSAQSEQLKERAMDFACEVLRLVDTFPRRISTEVVGRQLARSATSVALNYRASCIARSRVEFIAKLGVVVEEADESEGWLDLITRSRVVSANQLTGLHSEARQLRAIFGKSLGTARENLRSARQVRSPKQINPAIK